MDDDTEIKSNVGAKHDKCGEVNVVYALRLKNEIGAVWTATFRINLNIADD